MSDDRHTSELRTISRCRMRARVVGYDGQTDLRLIGAVQIIEPISRALYRGACKQSWAPERCIFNEPLLLLPGPVREVLTTRQQSAKQTHLWSTRVYVSRTGPASVSRTTCPLNIHEPSPRISHGEGERDVDWSCIGKRIYCDSIDLSFAHSDYRSAIL